MMFRSLVLAAALLPAVRLAAEGQAEAPADADNLCITCHGESDLWEQERRRFYITDKHFAKDIHWQRGLRCQDCHGGDPTTLDFAPAHAQEAGFRTVKSPADLPGFCGRCHSDNDYMRRYQPSPVTDQESKYWTSGHGLRLKADGDAQVATCVSCHHAPHGSGDDFSKPGILPAHDLASPVYPTNLAKTCATCHADQAKMAGRQYHGRPIGHQQYEQWVKSVHGQALLQKGDLSAPACNDCHGNHGAMPPDVDSVANACGTCHVKVSELFAKTRMRHQFETAGLPGCATCHGSHDIRSPTDEMLGMTDTAVCNRCHAQGKFGATVAGTDAARSLRRGLDQLRQQIARAEAKLERAERLGMEVSQPQFDLREASDALTNARSLIHTFAAPVRREFVVQDGEKLRELLAELGVKEQAAEVVVEYGRWYLVNASTPPVRSEIVIEDDKKLHESLKKLGVQGEEEVVRIAVEGGKKLRLQTLRPDPASKSLGDGFKVTREVDYRADEILEEYTFRRIWLASTLAPIVLVIGLLLLYIRRLPPPVGGGEGAGESQHP